MAFFSSKDLPNVRPVADFNFAATKILDNRINFSRGSVGTYIDNMGIVRYAPHNVPRFDHAPTTGESLGLLIEESRTNMVEYSDFTTGWNEYGGTATSTTETTAPDGTFTAKKITSKGDQSSSGIYDSINYTANTTYTHTMWLKAGSVTIAGITVHTPGNWASSNFPYITVNLSTGAVTASGGVSAKATAYPNGWYRLEATGTKSSSTGVDSIWVHSQTGSSMSGNTTDYYYVWGPQAEQGNFGTSYIPSSQGNGTTRNEDRAIVKGEKFGKVFDTGFNSFSALLDYDNIDTVISGTSNGILHLWGEANGYDDRISVSSDNDTVNSAVRTRAFGGGNPIFINNDALSASNQAKTQKFAFSWSVPDYSNTSSRKWAFSFSGEDVDVVSDGTGTSVPQVTRLGLGINPTRLDEHGGKTHFKRVAIYNKALSDEELKGLSAI